MKKIILLVFGFLPLLLPTKNIFAQGVRVNDAAFRAWYILTGTTHIGGKFNLFHDFHFRRSDLGANPQQTLLRAGLLYDANDKVQVGGGFVHVWTYPYGEYPQKNVNEENRLWQQVQIKQPIGKFTLFQRYRLEQRWIGSASLGGFQTPRFENRARFMGRLNLPIPTSEGKISFYANIFDEVFINFGDEVARNIFDQNRIGGNFGIKFNKNISLELGYIFQTLARRAQLATTGQDIFEQNSTFTTSLVSKF